MFAGHGEWQRYIIYWYLTNSSETTANTLAGTIGLLAIYPETQEYIYRGIVDVLGGREPVSRCF